MGATGSVPLETPQRQTETFRSRESTKILSIGRLFKVDFAHILPTYKAQARAKTSFRQYFISIIPARSN